MATAAESAFPTTADVNAPTAQGAPSSDSISCTGPVASEDGGFHISDIPQWTKWLVGSLLCLAVPVYRTVWHIEGEVEQVVETVAEDVVKVAAVVEKVASGIADSLPKDSIVENDFVLVEHWAEEVAEEAKTIEEFIQKVDEVKEKIEQVMEPLIKEAEAMSLLGPGIAISSNMKA